ncbi:hypothetical protein [Parabacteroides sp. AM08-6]|uniref:hypothetical protein n=1 Tax=Parabacteroides sp. AM08-6 TaxID=2292053 RepID=UPI0013140977|nr:hypothetical protein [Parabacteroides sp. AM08-6]
MHGQILILVLTVATLVLVIGLILVVVGIARTLRERSRLEKELKHVRFGKEKGAHVVE